MGAKRLTLHRAKGIAPPDRGPLLSPRRVFERFFRDGWPDVKDGGRWVRDHLPPAVFVRISARQTGVYAKDVEAYLEAQRGE